MKGGLYSGELHLGDFQYDIWGDTVNTASRMESQGSTRSALSTLGHHKVSFLVSATKRINSSGGAGMWAETFTGRTW